MTTITGQEHIDAHREGEATAIPVPCVIDRTHANPAYVTYGFGDENQCEAFIKATRSHCQQPRAAVMDMAKILGDEYFRLCALADRKPMAAGFWMEQLCAALEAVLKGK